MRHFWRMPVGGMAPLATFAVPAMMVVACGERPRFPGTAGSNDSIAIDSTVGDSLPSVALRRPEGFPTSVVKALDRRSEAMAAAARVGLSERLLHGLQSVFTLTSRWKPGDTLNVAFRGGSPAVRRRIAAAARAWTDTANLHLNFWTDGAQRIYREWSTTDKEYTAHIRIAFLTGEEGGYWSHVGKDAIDSSVARPSEPSMNYEGFDRKLPSNYVAVVLHEFGHALGFQHEHQSPRAKCAGELRWDDDPGYVPTTGYWGDYIQDDEGRLPGVYTVLTGPPNKWDSATVYHNLRRLPFSESLEASAFDSSSIMMYHFPGWMFKKLPVLTCKVTERSILSSQDLRAAATYYSRNPSVAVAAQEDAEEAARETLDSILPAAPKKRIESALDSIEVGRIEVFESIR